MVEISGGGAEEMQFFKMFGKRVKLGVGGVGLNICWKGVEEVLLGRSWF